MRHIKVNLPSQPASPWRHDDRFRWNRHRQDASQPARSAGESYAYYSIAAAEAAGLGDFSRLPAALKVVLENMLRFEDGKTVTLDDIRAFSDWARAGRPEPARDRLPAGAGADAGLHRRAGGGRPRGDARRDGRRSAATRRRSTR